MTEKLKAIAVLCMFAILSGCASFDSHVAQDLRLTLINTQEIGYGTGHGTNVNLLGKISEKGEIDEIVSMLKFSEESDISSQEPLDRYLFFMNANKTMTTIRFEGEKIRYQGKEYKMNSVTKEYLNRLYQ